MERIFKRKLYEKMLFWKHEDNGKTALLIEGARRVGKSTIAEEFAKHEYDSYILIDFNKAPKKIKDLFEDLDNLDYIKIPLEDLPMHLMEDNAEVAGCLQIINELSLQPIVNLTGYTNTDLKLEYGTANITVLTEYDQSYTLLVNTLQTWAKLLYDAGYVEETRKILEFAVSTRTDVTASYDLLADIYLQDAAPEKIQTLLSTAENLNSLSKQVILRHLQEKLPQTAPS